MVVTDNTALVKWWIHPPAPECSRRQLLFSCRKRLTVRVIACGQTHIGCISVIGYTSMNSPVYYRTR